MRFYLSWSHGKYLLYSVSVSLLNNTATFQSDDAHLKCSSWSRRSLGEGGRARVSMCVTIPHNHIRMLGSDWMTIFTGDGDDYKTREKPHTRSIVYHKCIGREHVNECRERRITHFHALKLRLDFAATNCTRERRVIHQQSMRMLYTHAHADTLIAYLQLSLNCLMILLTFSNRCTSPCSRCVA